jgi:hypothetical protein
MTILQRVGLWLALEATVFAQLDPGVLWTAYNDLYVGASRTKYTTAWNMFGPEVGGAAKSGALMDSATGQSLPVVLTLNAAGQVFYFQSISSVAPAKDTPADIWFDDQVDWSGSYQQTIPMLFGGSIDFAFSKLDTNKLYRFVGSGVLGGDFTSSPGWTLVVLNGADASVPMHSAGKAIYTDGLAANQAVLNIGQNRSAGDYVCWSNIRPGAKGTFTVRCTRYGGRPPGAANGQFGFGLVAVSLQEFIPTNTPVFLTVQPTNQTAIELSEVVFRAKAFGNPVPSYQWYRNDLAILGATNETCALDVVTMGDNQSTFFVVANNMASNVNCTATSQVARLTVLLDTNAPTMFRVLPPPKAAVSSLSSVEILFDKPVTGIAASDLLINGAAATNVTAVTTAQYLFEFPQPPLGEVQVAWSAAQAIRDVTTSANRFQGGGWTYNLTTNLLDFISITEIMAANKHGIRDEDGDYADWIELHNSGLSPVPLTSCYLTTEPGNLTKWQFPPFVLEPESYVVIWASGKNRTNSTSPLHTNFKLNKQGGYLALIRPDGGQIVSTFTPDYPAQQSDVSYGRDRSDPSLLGYFTSPTPNAPNATSGPDFGPDVRFSRGSGTFIAPFELRLSTVATNAVIRYAMGTNLPTETSPLYTGPISITNSIQVRARTFVPGLFPGDVQSQNYIYLDTATTNVVNFKSTLPILVLHNHGGGAIPVSENSGGYAQFAMLQVFEPKNGVSSLTNIPDLAMPATIHRRGQATLYNPKANLRLETIDEHDGGKSASLLGFPADNDWILYGINGYDKVLMHNPLAHELYRQLGRYSSRTRFVEVFLKDDSGPPGPIKAADYNGLYVLEEKIKISPDRVAIDKLQPENTNAPSITGGYLFSVDKSGTMPGFYAAAASMWYLDPNGPAMDTPQRTLQRQYLNDYLDAFYTALDGPDWKDPEKGYAAYIDVPAWIDFHLHQVLVFNVDMLRISTYYCKPRNGKLAPAALWDFDRAFGMYSADQDQRGFNPWRWRARTMDGGTDPFNAAAMLFDNPWYGKMFKDPDFWQRWIDRYQELRSTVYSTSNLTALIERLANEVAEATPREYTRWAGQGNSDTTPNRGSVTGDGWTYVFPNPGTWQGEVQFIKTWFTNRVTFMDTNFLDRPTASQPAGPIALGTALTIAPANEDGSYLVFTLDGTDPRLPSGGILSTAFSNLGPVTVTVTNPIRLCARSWNPSHHNLTGANNPPISSSWSGPLTATFYQTEVPALRITEIMYHPSAPPAGDPTDPDEFEFVELANIGTRESDLVGYKFISGISFAFTATNPVTRLAPGQQVLVVRNLTAFASRYPGRTNAVAGTFDGHLNNAGDRLLLVGPFDEVVEDVIYDPKWSPITDGLGFSLVALDSSVPPEMWPSPNQWGTSASVGGSPGNFEVLPTKVPIVLVNEILSAPQMNADDAVELWNPNANPVDIGYWYLTDDVNAPTKYLIPPGTTIPGLGFVVLHKTNSFGLTDVLNALNRTNTSFGLKDDGDQIYLFSGNSAGNLTGYYHGFSYGPSLSGVTWGSYINSVRETKYVALSSNTLGATNASPLIGPVVISELMFDPPALVSGGVATQNTSDEYVELHNLTSQPVPLFDTNHPANTWRLGDGIHYEFPSGVIMAPHGYLLVVNFSPEADPDSLNAFRERYGLATNVSVYGPYEGRLNPAGDQVSLRQTGGPNPDAPNPPLVLVDHVNYGVTTPWLTNLNQTGDSLQRKNDAAFGDDPASWIATNPTPGWSFSQVSPISLNIELFETKVTISWIDHLGIWQLEEAEELSATAVWQPVAVTPVKDNGWWRAVLPASQQTNRYYRLKTP